MTPTKVKKKWDLNNTLKQQEKIKKKKIESPYWQMDGTASGCCSGQEAFLIFLFLVVFVGVPVTSFIDLSSKVKHLLYIGSCLILYAWFWFIICLSFFKRSLKNFFNKKTFLHEEKPLCIHHGRCNDILYF